MPSSSLPSPLRRLLPAFKASLILGVLAFFCGQPARGTTYYWDTNGVTAGSGVATGNWGTSAFWSTNPAGTSATANTLPTNADDVIFSAGTNGTSGTVTISGTQAASSVTFDDPVTMILTGASLTLGGTGSSSGIFLAANGTTTVSAPLLLNAASTALNFSNSGSNLLTIGAVTGGTASTQTVTVGSSGNGGITLNGIIANGSGGTVGLVVNNTGSGITTLSGVNTFTGGFSVRAGEVNGGNALSYGAATDVITLGDSSGGANATLRDGSFTITNPITVNAGTTGTLTLGNTTTSGTTFSGVITLNNNLTLATNSTGLITVSGKLTGTGSVTANAGSGGITFSGTTNDYTGNLTFTGNLLTLNDASALGGNGGTFTIAGQKLDNTTAVTVTFTSTKAQNWNSDFTYLASRSIVFGSGAITLNANRIVTVNTTLTGNTMTEGGGVGDGGGGFSLTKAGLGTLTLNGANTYSGATIVTGGILNMSAAASSAANTSAVSISGGTLNLGTTGTGVANRINSAAGLTLGGSNGGGTLQLAAGATGPVNSQQFTSLTLGQGSNQLSTSSTTNAATFSFTGAGSSVYNRSLGSTIRFQSLATSNSLFVNAPTGASTIGTGSAALLIGAVSGTAANVTTDFVKAAAGVLAAPTYTTNTWASGNNTTVTANTTVAAGSTTQSVRFNDAIARTVTLSGTNTLESGGILVTSNANSGQTLGPIQTITGGTLQAASGQDLWVYTAGSATQAQDLNIASVIGDNGGSSLTKSGGRTLYLSNTANTYAGGTYLNEGTLNVVAGGSLGDTAGALNFRGSATLQAGAATVDLGTRAISIATNQTAIFDSNRNTLLASGVISGTNGSLTKTGAGTLTLSGANTYTGVTDALRGTLRLDFSAAGAPTSNIVSNASMLLFGQYVTASVAGSSILEIQGNANTANTQAFVSTVIGRGAGHLNLAAGSGTGTLVVSLGAVGRNTIPGLLDAASPQGSTLDISIGAGVTVTTTSTSLTNGILGPSGLAAVTVNGTSWATVTGGAILPLAAYNTGTGGISTATANTNIDVTTSATLASNPNTIRFNTPAANTLGVGTLAVRSLVAGGILMTSNVGANLSTIGAGVLSGASRRDLIIFQNNTAGDLEIDATLVDFNGGALVNTKSGAGKVVFFASNTNTGATLINEGTVVANGDVVNSFTRAGTSGTNNTTLTVTDTSGIFLGQAVTGGNLTGTNLTYTVVGIDAGTGTITLSSVTNGTGAPATFTFGGAAGLGVGTGVTHAIAPGATLQVGNGGTTGNLVSSQLISNNGALILNRSNDFTFANGISGTGTLEKQGAGNATLSVANTYTGDTKISGGSLILGNATALGTGTLDYNTYGGSLSFGSLTAATLGGIKGNQDLSLTNAAATPAAVALTVGSNNQSTTYSGNLTGLGSLTKTGGGTLLLSGTNAYAGATTISAGNLQVGAAGVGSISGSAVINGTTSILSGTGNAGATTLTLGSINPGDNGGALIGTLNLTSLATSSGTLLNLDIDTPGSPLGTSDHINVAGTLSLNNGTVINVAALSGFTSGTPAAGQSWDLLDWGAITGSYAPVLGTNLNLPDVSSYNLTWKLDQFTTSGIIYLGTAAIPEPGRVSLMLLSLAGLFCRRRR